MLTNARHKARLPLLAVVVLATSLLDLRLLVHEAHR
jgi:hypothetical protein